MSISSESSGMKNMYLSYEVLNPVIVGDRYGVLDLAIVGEA